MDSLKTLKIARNGYIVMSFIFCAVGIFLIAQPESSEQFICILIGMIFIVDGVIKIIGYFSKDLYCLAFQVDFAFGVLMIAVGMLILIRQDTIFDLIFAIFGLLILADALVRIQMSIEAKKFGINVWWRILIIAIVTGVFGMILLVDPAEGGKLTMISTGVAFLLEGCLNLGVVVCTVKILEDRTRDYSEKTYD